MSSLEEIIDEKVGEVRTDALDLSFGEIVNLHSNKELIIQPEYQRLFRWSDEQRSRLVESIVLELPIPQIFVIENSDGVLELIDGLQRVSSVIQFINPSVLDLEPLRLQGCDLVKELDGRTFEDLSLRLKLRIKRSTVRTVLIKRQSKPFLKYEMFKRLNTGGATLSPQEIRNCSARMVEDVGVKFYSFLQQRSLYTAYKNCIESLSEQEREKKGEEELVLRFLATKNSINLFRGSVRDWLDTYMEKILLGEIDFDYDKEENDFNSLFDYLNRIIGSGAFVKYRDSSPIGGLAPAYYEAVTVGTFDVLDRIREQPDEVVKKRIIDVLQSEDFRRNTGSGANKLDKLLGRISSVRDALSELISNE